MHGTTIEVDHVLFAQSQITCRRERIPSKLQTAVFGIREYLSENTASVMETNQGQPRTSSGKILFFLASKQNRNDSTYLIDNFKSEMS